MRTIDSVPKTSNFLIKTLMFTCLGQLDTWTLFVKNWRSTISPKSVLNSLVQPTYDCFLVFYFIFFLFALVLLRPKKKHRSLYMTLYVLMNVLFRLLFLTYRCRDGGPKSVYAVIWHAHWHAWTNVDCNRPTPQYNRGWLSWTIDKYEEKWWWHQVGINCSIVFVLGHGWLIFEPVVVPERKRPSDDIITQSPMVFYLLIQSNDNMCFLSREE